LTNKPKPDKSDRWRKFDQKKADKLVKLLTEVNNQAGLIALNKAVRLAMHNLGIAPKKKGK
jgi:hypothetical protein